MRKRHFSPTRLLALLLAAYALCAVLAACAKNDPPEETPPETVSEPSPEPEAPEPEKKPETIPEKPEALPEPAETPSEPEAQSETEPQEGTIPEAASSKGYIPASYDGNFEAYQEANPDIVAWIQVAGTKIDYPVCRSETDNAFYLDHTAKKGYSVYGAIFMENYNSASFEDFNTVLYGHNNRSNDNEFTQLHRFEDADFCEANRTITVCLPDHTNTYSIFAAYKTDNSHILFANSFASQTGREAYLEAVAGDAAANGWFDDGAELSAKSRILTLSTCVLDDKQHRWVVLGVLNTD